MTTMAVRSYITQGMNNKPFGGRGSETSYPFDMIIIKPIAFFLKVGWV
jgi:hypothetical protein